MFDNVQDPLPIPQLVQEPLYPEEKLQNGPLIAPIQVNLVPLPKPHPMLWTEPIAFPNVGKTHHNVLSKKTKEKWSVLEFKHLPDQDRFLLEGICFK